MRCHNKIQILSVLNAHLVSYPTPMNLNYSWNGGSLAGMMLASQMLTGILLAMHYVGHVDYAFASVQHLMTDVPSGMILRYAHANGASLFFIVVYLHVLRGMYYGSGAQPREMVWISGVVILLVMIITAFIGYVLPWGFSEAPNGIIVKFSFIMLRRSYHVPRIPAHKRIGPHSLEFCDIAVGLLLSDAHAEKHGNGVRLSLNQGVCHKEFFDFVAKKLFDLGYVSHHNHQPLKNTDSKGNAHYHLRLNSFTFSSLNWIHELFYVNGKKVIKPELQTFISARALAYWISGDGGWANHGLRLATHSFTYSECGLLKNFLWLNFKLECTIQPQGKYFVLLVKHSSMNNLRNIVLPFLHPSMHYKVFHNKIIV